MHAIITQLRVTQTSDGVIVIKSLLGLGRRLDVPFEKRPVERRCNLHRQLRLSGARFTLDQDRSLQRNCRIDRHHQDVRCDVGTRSGEFLICHAVEVW